MEIILGLMTSWPVTRSSSVILPPDPETPTSCLTFNKKLLFFFFTQINVQSPYINRNKIEISEGASYNISVQLKSCDKTLGDEGDSGYVTRSEPCKGKF